MLVFRSAAFLVALLVMSAPRTAVGQAQSQPAAVAPEQQEMAARRAKEREKINNCQKQATEKNILPRDRPSSLLIVSMAPPNVISLPSSRRSIRNWRQKERRKKKG
jgi:hypothetical protein